MSGSFKDLTVYKKAYSLAMEIFEVTKKFPVEEKYELTDQIRRSSRAVCRAIGEGYRKRQYPRHFSSKMSDADMENTETQVSIDFALSCKYITEEVNKELLLKSEEIGRMLNHMVENPEKYSPRHTMES
ncbi:MAG: four helix bundle protein [Lentimicrobium sp.]